MHRSSMTARGESAIGRRGQATRRQTSRSRLAPATLRSMTDFDDVLATIDTWGADHAAAVVIGPAGVLAGRGEAGHRFRWASVTKLATAWCVLIAADRGLLDLDEAAGPPGSTVRHLLAHASGLPFEGQATLAAPGTRRIYSNPGFRRPRRAGGGAGGPAVRGGPRRLGPGAARDGRHAPRGAAVAGSARTDR